MKKLVLGIVVTCCAVTKVGAQDFNKLFSDAEKKVEGAVNTVTQKTGNINSSNAGTHATQYSKVSNSDAISGLREALTVGASNASGKLAATNGFFGNAAIKILMPAEAKKVENTMRELGMGSQVDKAILTMNRAAEDASAKAVPIFRDAILHMSLTDGLSILKGGNGAATRYLRNTTTAALTAAFKPVIQASLNKVNATKYWADVFNIYNELPTTFNKVNPDLAAYVTERALNGLFLAIADEENKIRTDPAAQISSLLQKVFGGK